MQINLSFTISELSPSQLQGLALLTGSASAIVDSFQEALLAAVEGPQDKKPAKTTAKKTEVKTDLEPTKEETAPETVAETTESTDEEKITDETLRAAAAPHRETKRAEIKAIMDKYDVKALTAIKTEDRPAALAALNALGK